MSYIIKKLVALTTTCVAIKAPDQIYNGYIEHFIADIGPGYPCSPYYEYASTWFKGDTDEGVRAILRAVVKAGFNGVRLPMWPGPDNELVRGQDPNDEDRQYSGTECDDISKRIARVLREHKEDPEGSGLYTDDAYHFLSIYYSPAFDNRYLQEDLTSEQYAQWTLAYLLEPVYGAQFISPFSATASMLTSNVIHEDDAGMSDPPTLFELETLAKIRGNLAYQKLRKNTITNYVITRGVVTKDSEGKYMHRLPRIIGPDRDRLEHSLNLLRSFKGKTKTRPKYIQYVDIIGTQSSQGDFTSQLEGWEALVKTVNEGSVLNVWCSMCCHEWDRVANAFLENKGERYSDVSRYNNFHVKKRLMARFKKQSYWEDRLRYAPPMPPGSQSVQLQSKVSGYVACSAIPRFISKDGVVNQDRTWARDDRIIDNDGNMRTCGNCAQNEAMVNRNNSIPINGMRQNGFQSRMEKACPQDGNSPDTVYLRGYDTCQFYFTIEEFARGLETQKGKRIKLYLDYTTEIIGHIETCTLTKGIKSFCRINQLQPGVYLDFFYAPQFSIALLFENSRARTNTIRLTYSERIITATDANTGDIAFTMDENADRSVYLEAVGLGLLTVVSLLLV